jgi:hypothetical protein
MQRFKLPRFIPLERASLNTFQANSFEQIPLQSCYASSLPRLDDGELAN